MLYKDSPVFSLELAESFLRQHFRETSKDKILRNSLKTFCQECSVNDKNMLRIFFRLVKIDVNQALISAVIDSLPEDEKKYVSMKYCPGGTNVTKQEQEIHVTRGQLNIWRKKILADVWRALNYELTMQDIYFPKKVINMMEALATLLSFYNEMDPSRKVTDAYTCQCLEYYYNSYRRLYDELYNCFIYQGDCQKMNLVVSTIIKHPYLKKEALSRLCGLNQGTFSRYQKAFEDRVKPYVIESF